MADFDRKPALREGETTRVRLPCKEIKAVGWKQTRFATASGHQTQSVSALESGVDDFLSLKRTPQGEVEGCELDRPMGGRRDVPISTRGVNLDCCFAIEGGR